MQQAQQAQSKVPSREEFLRMQQAVQARLDAKLAQHGDEPPPVASGGGNDGTGAATAPPMAGQSSEVEIVAEMSRSERDARGFASAVVLDADESSETAEAAPAAASASDAAPAAEASVDNGESAAPAAVEQASSTRAARAAKPSTSSPRQSPRQSPRIKPQVSRVARVASLSGAIPPVGLVVRRVWDAMPRRI